MLKIETRIADFDDPDHADAIVEIINAYAMEDHGGGKRLPDEVNAAIVPGMQATPGAFTMMAFDGETPVGIAVCFRGFSTFSAKPLVNIHDLSVLEAYRGQGVGTKLLEAVENHAKKTGCCKVTLECRDANPRAGSLYERKGYSDPDGFATRFLDKRL